tara:strand:+ start:1028 stop:1279 length:252 start_codon:yes stop_codon:yes gene_type:complete
MSYQKIYYDNNKKEILQQKKEYYLENQTQLIDDKKRYYTLNRDIILQKNNRKLLCDCGSIVTYSNFKRHFKTKKHKDYLLNIQ